MKKPTHKKPSTWGQVITVVGLCPVKPAEFVIIRITQFEGGSEVTTL